MNEQPNEVHDIIETSATAQAQITRDTLWIFALIVVLIVLTVVMAEWIGTHNCEVRAVAEHALQWDYNIFGGCVLGK